MSADQPDPLGKHDDFLDAQLTAMAEPHRKQGGKIALIHALRQETDLGLKEALAVVNDYCARKHPDLGPKPSRAQEWLSIGITVFCLISITWSQLTIKEGLAMPLRAPLLVVLWGLFGVLLLRPLLTRRGKR